MSIRLLLPHGELLPPLTDKPKSMSPKNYFLLWEVKMDILVFLISFKKKFYLQQSHH